MNQTQEFSHRIDDALHNDQLRRNFRAAMSGVMERRADQFPDDDQLQALREQAQTVRANSLVKQPELLEQLEKNGGELDRATRYALSVAAFNRVAQYDDAIGGSARIVEPLPPMVAIPTTVPSKTFADSSSMCSTSSLNRYAASASLMTTACVWSAASISMGVSLNRR